MTWAETWPSAGEAFLSSFVEFVEALTVVLATGAVRGWAGALSGSAAALAILAVATAVIGPALLSIPLHGVQLAVGIFTLLFGARWLRKAVLRAAGAITLHDAAQAFEKETGRLLRLGARRSGRDRIAFAGAFKITAFEDIEVFFIVVAVHRPLTRVPENTLKFLVGTVLSAFGTFWTGEGFGLRWAAEDIALLWLIAGYLVVALIAVPACRRRVGNRALGGAA